MLQTFTCEAFAGNSGQSLECGATCLYSWREKLQGAIISPRLLVEKRIISLYGGAAWERDRHGEKKDDHLWGKESKAGWDIRLDCCLEALGWRSGPVWCRGRIQKRRSRLCNGGIARHREGRTVGWQGDWWFGQRLEKRLDLTHGVNLLDHVVAMLV